MEYSEFIDFLFQRPDDREWYFGKDFVGPDLTADVAVLNTTRFFSESDTYAAKFSEQGFCLALNYLINPSSSDHCYSYFDPSVTERNKTALFASMYDVFCSVFAVRCSDKLSHSTPTRTRTYNNVCYMWWDVLPRHGVPAQKDLLAADRAILSTLSNILLLKSIACKESALHGLGHWYAGYPEFVESLIAGSAASIPAQLSGYAADAKTGRIQ